MSNEIIKVLNALCDKIGVTIDWNSKNAMLYLQQVLTKYANYELWYNVVFFCVGVVCLCFFVYMLKKAKYYYHKAECEDSDEMFVCGVCIAVFFILLGIGLYLVINSAIQVVGAVTFPEKIILDTIQDMIDQK